MDQNSQTESVKWYYKYTERDWQEDEHEENGRYSNKCAFCDCTFVGHKRRVICKVCNN